MVEQIPPVTLLLADWVAPMDRPLLHSAGVAIAGDTILAVGHSQELRSSYPAATIADFGRAVLMPGLVNAHVHLELSALKPGDKPASFVDWIKRLVHRSPVDSAAAAAFVEKGVAIGIEQCRKFGVTTIGDISRHCVITRPLLKSSGLRAVSYGEVQAMARRRHFLDERVAIAADDRDATDRLRIGISPHAPYSIEADGYRKCLDVARAGGLPISTHLAETPAEVEFLADHAGPFRELWSYLDAWDEQVPKFPGGPIRFARELGLLDYPTLLAHVNYCDDDELGILAQGQASVVYCPRTHDYFGHPPHRWRDMLAVGINVAVGTDSCASSPDLNLVDDLRLLHKIAPEVTAMELWQMATIRAARAIGWQNRVGSLSPGKAADVIWFPVTSDDPLAEILESDSSDFKPLPACPTAIATPPLQP
jgi:cytosine/adenosine deaminase-related metal-dependent hydrolase